MWQTETGLERTASEAQFLGQLGERQLRSAKRASKMEDTDPGGMRMVGGEHPATKIVIGDGLSIAKGATRYGDPLSPFDAVRQRLDAAQKRLEEIRSLVRARP
jgi:hypothetical protein